MPSPDAHDAGLLVGGLLNRHPPDAHDAGP